MEDQQRTLHVCRHLSFDLYFSWKICPKLTSPVTTSLFHQHYKTDSSDPLLPDCLPNSPSHPHPCFAPCSLLALVPCSHLRWTSACSPMSSNRALSQRLKSSCCPAGSVRFAIQAWSCSAPSLESGRECEPCEPEMDAEPAGAFLVSQMQSSKLGLDEGNL